MSRSLASIACATLFLLAPLGATAQQQSSGSTLSPDLQSYMVNKDLGIERWTIALNLYSTDPASIISITGNIFRSDGGPASFVTCLERADSEGSLLDPTSVFRLSCSGADACLTTAERCAREGWTPISEDVLVPSNFFLPPGGNGTAQAARVESFLDHLIARLGVAFARVRGSALARGGLDLAGPREAFAQNVGGRGATLTLDRLNHLVTKDIGSERWSISYSLEPFETQEQGVADRFLNVTGNVFQSDGSPPSFVYCEQREDSTGSLSDPSSEFVFRCEGSDACTGTALECAQNEWRLISNDVRLQASFFLPPDGLPASPQSDPEIVIIGRTSDPPSVGIELGAETQAFRVDRPAGTCPVGDGCFVERIGACQSVAGEIVDLAGIGGDCACVVDAVPPGCIGCGDGAVGQCGGGCQYAVDDATARGICLPFDAQSSECTCYAIGAGQDLVTEGCGGALGLPCPGDRCCANDPRGSCDPLAGEIMCPGVCVAASGCDPDVQQCGICMSPVGVPTATPTPAPTSSPTPGATPTAAPTAQPTPVPSPSPTPTAEPICLAEGEECLGLPFKCCDGLVCNTEEPGESFCEPIIP
jgi:hypothetical protein